MSITQTSEILSTIKGRKPTGLFITDLDGTLLKSDRTVSNDDLDALNLLGEKHVVRVLATGRSLYSLDRVDIAQFPIDYILFSTGAGVVEHPKGRLVRKANLESHEVELARNVLKTSQLDFMIHRPIPENHAFDFFRSNQGNADFESRIHLYQECAFPLNNDSDGFGPASQLLAVVPPSRSREALAAVRNVLKGLNVIQTTSPLDGKSTWIEIFPAEVSKSQTAAWLAAKIGVTQQQSMAVGNDFNDLDLLEWAGDSYVVANAPDQLKTRFQIVASHDNSGVAEAVNRWLKK